MEDAQRHARNHAWIYIQMSRFAQQVQGNKPGASCSDVYDFDKEMNVGGMLDEDPWYLDIVINKFYKRYDLYGL